MEQTYRSRAGRLPDWRIIDAESWTVRGPAGPELRRAPAMKPGFLHALRIAVGRLLPFAR